jgi:sugar phosphate isomerase/epimerase
MKMSRRAVLAALGAAACGEVPREQAANSTTAQPRFRLAVCNETFQDASFAEGCRLALKTGYTGLEISPFTLSEDPASFPDDGRRECRDAMASEGVEYVGLHNLLTAPRGELHITTPDDARRNKSWDYFRKLIDLCGDLGERGIMVLGSGKQRNAVEGSSVEDATKRLRDGLGSIAGHAGDRGITILPETLAPHLCDVLTSLDQTVAMVEEINHPAIRTMFDTHNAVAETMPHDELIKKHADYIRHVHIYEMVGRHPTTGDYDFRVPLRGLKEISYDGWVSLEVFQFEPSGEEIARISSEFLRKTEEDISTS